MKFLLHFLQETPVEPEPIKVSKIKAFSLVNVLTNNSINSNGFCVGCNPPLTLLYSNKVVGYLEPSLQVL